MDLCSADDRGGRGGRENETVLEAAMTWAQF